MAKNGIISRLFGRSNAAPAKQASSQSEPSYEGQLLRGTRTAPVYKIEDGRKRWIVTEEVFLRHGFSWADVCVVPRETVAKIPSGNNIT